MLPMKLDYIHHPFSGYTQFFYMPDTGLLAEVDYNTGNGGLDTVE